MPNSHDKQQGISLIELMLVMVIVALLTVVGLRQYNVSRQYTRVKQLQDNVTLLLRAGGLYYLSHCISDASPGTDDGKASYQAATQALDTPLTLSQLQPFLLPVKVKSLVSPFGSFSEGGQSTEGKPSGSSFEVALKKVPFISSNPNDPTQGYGTTVLWQVVVSTCVQSLSGEKSSPEAVKAFFNADSVAGKSGWLGAKTCSDGVKISWMRLPRSATLLEKGYSVSRASQSQYTKMYQFSPWMKKYYARAGLDDFFNYVCQT